MLFLLTTLFFIPFSLSIERILNQTIGTSSSVNQASLSYSNQSFVLTPSYQFIINQDNSFTQRAVSYSETTNFVPLRPNLSKNSAIFPKLRNWWNPLTAPLHSCCIVCLLQVKILLLQVSYPPGHSGFLRLWLIYP